ncbi:MAG TPA: phage holin family protein [Clostridia bacterium]|nr:phage holin family protein [Clostridia bacterium]HHY06363.1 phage holin family protein [Clostridia bacterium]
MLGTLIRFLVSAIVLLVVSWLIPGFSVAGFTGAVVAAIVIALLGWVVEKLLGDKVTPRSRGLVGFISAAVVIYLAQYIVPGSISVSVLGALLASLVIGLIDIFIPTEIR